jgi:hypothetical protein
LRRGGVEVQQASRDFTAGGHSFEAGSYVAFAGQAFRPFLMDLMEPQEYPDRFEYEGGPPVPPYDLAGWTLPIQMGVTVERIEEPFELATSQVDVAETPAGEVSGSGDFGFALSHRENKSALAVNRLLASGDRVHWAGAAFEAGEMGWDAGTIVIESGDGTADRVGALARELGLDFTRLGAQPSAELYALQLPRLGMYKSYDPNMDEGWTRWLLERYEFPLETLHDADIRDGDLSRFDAIILPSQSASEMMHGHPPGTMPEEYVGGLGVAGAAALDRYVEQGGTVIALDEAAGFAIDQFSLRATPSASACRSTERRSSFKVVPSAWWSRPARERTARRSHRSRSSLAMRRTGCCSAGGPGARRSTWRDSRRWSVRSRERGTCC